MPIVVVALVGSVLTLLSMVKIWLGVFWGVQPESADAVAAGAAAVVSGGGHRVMVGATVVTVAATLAIAAGAGPLWELSERAAVALVDPTVYVQEVLR